MNDEERLAILKRAFAYFYDDLSWYYLTVHEQAMFGHEETFKELVEWVKWQV
jgi:hypothetical protein